MPGLPIYQLDAFAEAPFAGNPAAVVPLEAWLPGETLQAIAAENNLSETAFLVAAADDPAHDFALRWFTPAIEVDLCGHATLAAGAALFEKMGFGGERVRFSSRSGTLAVARAPGGRYELDFPARPGAPAEIPTGLAEALGGIAPVAFIVADKNMAVLSDEAAVRAARPDLGFIANLPGDGLIVTAPAASGGDCASRYFAPHAGIAEDPVTGSAHCTIVPYWAAQLGQSELHCRQLSARGGDLYCRLDGDRVRIAGRARLYLEGRIFLADT